MESRFWHGAAGGPALPVLKCLVELAEPRCSAGVIGDGDELLGWSDADLESAHGSGSLVAARRDGLGDLLDLLLLKDRVVAGLFGVFDVAVRGSTMAPLGRLAGR